MSIENNRYFVVEGGTAQKLIDEFQEREEQYKADLQKLKEDVGADNVIFGSGQIGMVFKKDPGKPWIKANIFANYKNGDMYRPEKRSKAGKALANRIFFLAKESDNLKSAHKFFEGKGDHIFSEKGQSFLSYPSFGKIDGKWVVCVHKGAEVKPVDGLKEIKASEYLAMLEKIEAKKSA